MKKRNQENHTENSWTFPCASPTIPQSKPQRARCGFITGVGLSFNKKGGKDHSW